MHIGILGGGQHQRHARRAAAAIPGVQVVACHGGNRERTEKLAAQHGATAYDTLEGFLDHRPMDIVAIGSPSGLHAQQGIAAAQRGLHVLSEKPLDITTERADALIEAVPGPASSWACSSRIACARPWSRSSGCSTAASWGSR